MSALRNLTPRVEVRQKPLGASSDKSRYHASVPHMVASPLNGVYSQPAGEVKIDALLN